MFPIHEAAPNGVQAGHTYTQQQMIASVIAQRRVVAAQAGAESNGASARQFADSGGRNKAIRNVERAQQPGVDIAKPSPPERSVLSDRSAEAKSIIEAQEASKADRKIIAAFQARYSLSQLLSVIRDPEDRVLPASPEE